MTNLPLRFWMKVRIGDRDQCWPWIGARHPFGHGHFWLNGKCVGAHRLTYEDTIGPISSDLDLDHVVCDNPPCVNPWHVRPATSADNTSRGRSASALNARKTSCPAGHDLTDPATTRKDARTGERCCRPCQAAAARRYKARKADR